MGYIHSSPWQDAANFGGAVGDRLSEALINLPLKKAQMTQQMLQNAIAVKQQQQQNKFRQESLDNQKQHYGAEEQHYQTEDANMGAALKLRQKDSETRKEKDFSSHLDNTVKEGETKRHNQAMEGVAQDRVKAAHDRVMSMAVTDKAPHPEFGGLTLGQVLQKANTGTLPPEIDKAFNEYLLGHLNQSSMGQALPGQSNAPAGGKVLNYNPATGKFE